MKNITIKDVAREAGVSTTTVSHVLNGRADEMRICEATRKKVMQVVNLLDYTPSNAARDIASKLSYRMAFACVNDGVISAAQNAVIAERLAALLKQRGYNLVLHPADDFSVRAGVDAIICYRYSVERFRKLGGENFAPLVAIDTIPNDPWLFFQINQDFKRLRAEAAAHFGDNDYTYAYIPSEDEAANNMAKAAFANTVCIKHVCELEQLGGRNINVLVTDTALKAVFPDAYHSKTYEDNSLSAAISCVEKAVSREQIDISGHFVMV